MSALPAQNLKLRGRGELKTGDYADIVIFDPATIADHATYDHPQQFATGVRDVFVMEEIGGADANPRGGQPGEVGAACGNGDAGICAAQIRGPAEAVAALGPHSVIPRDSRVGHRAVVEHWIAQKL